MKLKPGVYCRTAPQEDEQVQPRVKGLKSTGKSRVSELWLPEANTAFKFFMSANLAAALLSNISDCDETYNYWEPLHFLMYGHGFQTWEYSPAYAIRSWAYVKLHSTLTWVHLNMINSNKLLVFYFIRTMLALFCSLSEVHFYQGVALRFGNNVARMLLVFLTFGSGLFISGTAFLPSSFCMYMTCLTFGSWLKGYPNFAILSVACGAIVSWPFSAALGAPLAIDILFHRRQFLWFVKWCLIACLTMLLPCFIIDSYYYGKPVVACLNIILYNVFTEHGPDIYGVEPLSYYLLNGFLNFNIAFVLALLSGVLVTISIKIQGYRLPYTAIVQCLSPMYIWFAIFFSQPHKEERFLFPVYPLICLSAAVAIVTIQKLYCGLHLHKVLNFRWISLSALFVFVILSLSRSIALFQGYHAPIEIYTSLQKVSEDVGPHTNIRVCVGKEWYRYPSSFFLPSNFSMEFIKSDFRAQLPSHFLHEAPEGSRIVPQHMNDANLEEPSRYVGIESCHFLIDLALSHGNLNEPNYAVDKKQWETVGSVSFIDASRSPSSLARAFYIPYIYETKNSFAEYVLLRSRSKKIN